MPDATRFPQGTPCWVDLISDDPAAALAFYRPLLGWSGEPDPEYGGYAVLGPDGRPVAAIGPAMSGQPPAPTAWTVYFAVDDADAAAARISEHGGTVTVGPGDVSRTGRLALATDPAGAPFGIWQADPFPGFQAARTPGAPIWFELETDRGRTSAAFYSAVFGVPAPAMEQMPDVYWLLTVNGGQVAGIWQDDDTPGAPRRPQWNVYFQVADTDAAVETALAAGAATLRPARDSPYGRFATLADPQGARFSVIVDGGA